MNQSPPKNYAWVSDMPRFFGKGRKEMSEEDLRRGRARRKVDLVAELTKLGDELAEVWDE